MASENTEPPFQAIATLVLFLGVLAWVYFHSGDEPEASDAAILASRPLTGETGILRSNDHGPIPVSVTRAVSERVLEFGMAGADVGINQLITAGAVSMVPSRSRVYIIDAGPSHYEVRLVGGPLYGRTVFVSTGFWELE